MCMRVHVCVCVCACACASVCASVYMSVCVHVRVCARLCVYLSECVHACVCVCVCVWLCVSQLVMPHYYSVNQTKISSTFQLLLCLRSGGVLATQAAAVATARDLLSLKSTSSQTLPLSALGSRVDQSKGQTRGCIPIITALPPLCWGLLIPYS